MLGKLLMINLEEMGPDNVLFQQTVLAPNFHKGVAETQGQTHTNTVCVCPCMSM
jgi:hypothetical protein